MKYKINKKVASRPSVNKVNRSRMIHGMFSTIIIISIIGGVIWTGSLVIRKFLQHPDFVIKRLYIVNNKIISGTDIKNIARISTNMNIYATSLAPIKQRLEHHPDIRTVEITKQHPDMLVIKVFEREPYAILVSANKKIEIPVDREGIMLSGNTMEYAMPLPIIEGVKFTCYQPGMKLDDIRVPIAMQYLDVLLRVPQRTFLKIKKISMDQPDNIVLKTASIDEIHLGAEYTNTKVARLIAAVNESRILRINMQRIDLRFKDVVIVPRLL